MLKWQTDMFRNRDKRTKCYIYTTFTINARERHQSCCFFILNFELNIAHHSTPFIGIFEQIKYIVMVFFLLYLNRLAVFNHFVLVFPLFQYRTSSQELLFEKGVLKYAANLQENTLVEVRSCVNTGKHIGES